MGAVNISNKLFVNGTTALGYNLYIGDSSAADDDYIYFDRGYESIKWDDANIKFTFSDDIDVNGYIYFEGSGENIDWSSAASKFIISDDVQIGSGGGDGILQTGATGGAFANTICSSSVGYATYGSCSSSRAYKENINYLITAEYSAILDKITGMNIANYNLKPQVNSETGEEYISLEDQQKIRYGIIAEDLPIELQLENDGLNNTGVDWFSYQGYLHASIIALNNKVEKLEAEVALLKGA